MTRPLSRETAAVLEPFLQALRSDKTLAIPKATLLGALGHFFAILDGDNLKAYVQDVLNSPSLWKTVSPHDIEAAVRPAPASRVSTLKPKLKDTFFKRDRVAKASKDWLGDIVNDLRESGNPEHSLPILVGLLNGISDVKDIDWGVPRVELEETLVITVAERLDKEKGDEDVLRLFSSVAEDIQPQRLRVLDLRVVSCPTSTDNLSMIPELQDALFLSLEPSAAGNADDKLADAEDFSIGLSCAIEALAEGGSNSRAFAWDQVQTFTQRMFLSAEVFEREWSGLSKPLIGGPEWERQKAALSAFCTVEWPVIERLVAISERHINTEETVNLVTLIIRTLGKFSSVSEDDQEPADNYEKTLYGALDILAGEGGSRAVRELYTERDRKEHISESYAAFVLIVGEQLVRMVDSQTVRDFLLPLAGKYVVRPQHKASFQSAFAFLMALVDAASSHLEVDPSQGGFVEAMVQYVAHALLRESRDGSVTAEQLRQAYPQLVSYASRRSPELVHQCVTLLNNTQYSSDEYQKAVRAIRVGLIPAIPTPAMEDYLNSIANLILSVPKGSEERLELASLAFKAVMQEMPDETKQQGIDWWLKHRRLFDGRDESSARL